MSSNTDELSNNLIDQETEESAEQAAERQDANTATAESVAGESDVYISIDDLEDEKEYSEEEFAEMLNLYEKTLTDFVEGELIIGRILAKNDKEVAVDIGFKSEGVIPIDEFPDPDSIEVGADIEVYLDSVEDSEGQLVLSKKKADFLRIWEKILSSYENEDVLQGTCTRRIKGGIVVDLMGIDAFLPGSQIDVKPVRDFDALINKQMDFRIVKVNELRKNIVVSHRVLIEEGMKEQRQKILANLEKGQILEGSVKNITDFGVFIDLGGVDGLLHINDLAWGRVSHPSEIVALDEIIKIQILDFNEEKDRISLGLKQLQPHPWDNVKDKYTEGDHVKGRVVNITDYGSFVELEKGVEGLIHISEMSWTQHVKHPSKILSLGETVEAKILNIDHEGRKISLGLKQLEPDPWTDIEANFPVDSQQKGVVRNLTNFGAFVELQEGVDGLIHISDLSWTKKIRHPGEVVKKGDEVEIIVLNINKDKRRISLGYKQTMDNPWDTFEDSYQPDTTAKGIIVRMIEKGVIVELPDTVDGFVPLSQLQRKINRKPSDAYKVGDELELAVIEFNKDNKKIILSEKLAHRKGDSAEEAELAVEDREAIAEFEKEAAVSSKRSPRQGKKGAIKPAPSETQVVTEVVKEAETATDEPETGAKETGTSEPDPEPDGQATSSTEGTADSETASQSQGGAANEEDATTGETSAPGDTGEQEEPAAGSS